MFRKKIEEEEYLEDADVFFPAKGRDNEDAVDKWNFANCSEPSKKTENPKSRPGRAKKALT